ncbi:hypothetical protein QQS21_011097 [Conoideocrella luteorostrata]|uniref:Uncharacterized protein n=1 Tax=Conoideocrella luteorostrata TaxID=1105319 RepID=A0AAJ0CES6_9HYPO|nr:hypothetical protein QQS21_011097 [Conoideocrella luteorostrata]
MISTKCLASLAAVAVLLQMCPAPPAAIGAIVGGALGGAIGGGATLCATYCPKPKRIRGQAVRAIPPGVSQESINQCTSQINAQKNNGVTVQISNVDEGTVNVANVPPACMNLATVLSGDPAQAGGPVPVPMSSSSLQYTGLTTEDRKNLANALGV